MQEVLNEKIFRLQTLTDTGRYHFFNITDDYHADSQTKENKKNDTQASNACALENEKLPLPSLFLLISS